MLNRPRFGSILVAAALAAAGGRPTAAAPQGPALAPVQTAPLTQQIPTDPAIEMGTLPNGLRYYIRVNKQPADRAELRLVVKAGSVLEDEAQQGLAHFVEHMAFNGTTHFPGQNVIFFLQSIGMKIGPHVNANTGFDETTYLLEVPTDRPDVLDRTFLVLEDWAHNVTFDATEIDKERGVITEEWRLGRGAGARTTDQILPVLVGTSRYAARLPIGQMDVVQHAPPDRLRQFYRDWYRPDLMAVVAVGDFDPAVITREIESHFASIPNPPNERPRPVYDVPDRAATAYKIVTDAETTAAHVELDTLLPAEDQDSIGAYRQMIVAHLFEGMLSARLSEISHQPDAPFLGAGVGKTLFVARTREMASLSALAKEDRIADALQVLVAEVERVVRYGFTPTEFARQKADLLRVYQRLLAQKDTHDSSTLAAEYIRNFTQNEPLPGIANEYALHQRFLPAVTLAEVNRLAGQWFPDHDRTVIVTAPRKPGLTVPAEPALAAAITTATTEPLTPYVDTAATATLIETPPEPGRIVTTVVHDQVGVTEWELSNGVRVVLKPTTYKEDEILVRATSPGGTSLASDADFMPAETAAQVMATGGLGAFSAVDLRKVLTGKVAGVQPAFGETATSMTGSASPQDLGTLFQLIYLTFTAPRADAAMFGVLTSQLKSILANQQASPNVAFASARQILLTQNHLRGRPLTPEMVDQMNLDASLAFYKARFADAGNFTFVFVGSFDVETMRPLVERYLASLPSTGQRETWRDVGMRPPTGVVTRRVEKGIEPQSRASLVFTGPFQYNQMQRIAIRAMGQVLQGRLREVLREDLGGTYNVGVSTGYSKIPRAQYSVSIDFGCDPKRTDDLVRVVFDQIAKLKVTGPTPTEMTDVTAGFGREFETNIKDNRYLLSQIAYKYEYGEDVAGIWDLPQDYQRLTPAMILDAARTYLNTDNYVEITLFPQETAGGMFTTTHTKDTKTTCPCPRQDQLLRTTDLRPNLRPRPTASRPRRAR
jgi:zinc protease